MKLLAIDTSTALASVALLVEQDVVEETQEDVRQHAPFLLPMVSRVLSTAGLHFSQLDGIVFGRGPGSFTGIRIACSMAKGFALAYDLPVYPVSTLAAIAIKAWDESVKVPHPPLQDTVILSVMDARMNEIYWAFFKPGAADADECVTAASAVIIPDTSPLILAGVGLETYAQALPDAIGVRLINQVTVFPHASAMTRLVQSGQVQAVSAEEALPVYIRNPITQGESRG